MKQLGQISWKSPSNIAFIKYWGKFGNQYPQNPSLSMTLDKCHTITSIEVYEKERKSDDIDFGFLFHGKNVPKFTERIRKYFLSIRSQIPSLTRFALKINSENSFPHSAGIASSASALSALALCLVSLEQKLGNGIKEDFVQKAAIIARLGSGSATRSVYGGFTTWGAINNLPEASNDYSMPLSFNVAPIFKQLQDTILIIDSSEKKVSSSAGHSLMNGHPYAEQRFINARSNLNTLIGVLKEGDFLEFERILELEALSLHALMMTAYPWYTLLAPNTLLVLEKIKHFRETTGTQITFTLDAGPNVHVIYPTEEKESVVQFIDSELAGLCIDRKYITDQIGNGPELLLENF